MKEMIELASKIIKTTTISMLHLFKQVEENMNITMRREMENTKKDSNGTSGDEKCM